jgi:peptidyl-prolyl cis-trans isomerase A (cyclophilin A)
MRYIFLILVLNLSSAAWADKNGRIITDMGTIEIRLFTDGQPITTGNFIDLAAGRKKYVNSEGKRTTKPFYDGLIIHRVHPELGIFSGCPLGNGHGYPGYYIPDENVKDSKFETPFRLAMAKLPGDNKSGSQFFITTRAEPRLNGKYVVFGEVTAGQDIVTQISMVERDLTMKPKKPIHINKIEIDDL